MQNAEQNDAQYLLVKYRFNYADEFDITGFKLFTAEQWEREQRLIEGVPYPIEHYFGTNEFLEFDSAADFMDGLTQVPLTEEEYMLLMQLFPIDYGDPRAWPDFGDF